MARKKYSSHFDRMADEYSMDKNWRELAMSSYGQSNNITVTSGQSNRRVPNGVTVIDTYNGFTTIRMPKRPSKLDKLMAGIVSRFSYPGIVSKVHLALRKMPVSARSKMAASMDYRAMGIAEQIASLLAIKQGSGHFDNDGVLKNSRETIVDDFFDPKANSTHPRIMKWDEILRRAKGDRENSLRIKASREAQGDSQDYAIGDLKEYVSRADLAESMWADVMYEIAGSESNSQTAKGIVENFFKIPGQGIKRKVNGEYVHTAEDVASGLFNTALVIGRTVEDAYHKIPNPTGTETTAENFFTGANAPSEDEEQRKLDATQMKKGTSLPTEETITDVEDVLHEPTDEEQEQRLKVLESLTDDITSSFGGDVSDVPDITGDYNEEDVQKAIENAHNHYGSPKIFEDDEIHERRTRDVRIISLDAVGFGDEEQDMPAPSVLGIPTHKAWQLGYGNMEVFRNSNDEQPEVVVLLDHSGSMTWYNRENNPTTDTPRTLIDLGWSVAMAIKQAYSGTRIYPYSTYGIATEEIEVGNEVPALRGGGTPTVEALLWLKKKLHGSLDRTNVLLVSDDEQYKDVGAICTHLRDRDGMRIGVCKVGKGNNSYRNLSTDYYEEVKDFSELYRVQNILNKIMQES